MVNYVASFKACQWLVTVHLLFGSGTDSKVYNYVASLSFSGKPTWSCSKIDNQKKKLTHKGENAVKWKNDKAGNEIHIEHKWNYRRHTCP